MAKKSKKVAYVVFRGRKTGIFSTWDECSAQVNGFSNGKFQGYEVQHEADAAWKKWCSEQQANGLSEDLAGTTGRQLTKVSGELPGKTLSCNDLQSRGSN